MDISFLLGSVAGLGVVVFGILNGGGSFSYFIDVPSLFIVVGATLFCIVASFLLTV